MAKTVVRLFESSLLMTALCVGLSSSFSSIANAAADVPQSFTLDGRLFSNPAGTTPLSDNSVVFKIQILDEDKVCVLYEESQTTSTSASNGYFSVAVGSATGSGKRTSVDSGNTMANIFQNIGGVSGKLVSNGNPCTTTALAGKRRYVRITIAPSTMGGTERVLSPDLSVDSVPNAVVAERAESLQGLASTDFLKVNSSGTNVLTQSNLENLFTSTARFNALTGVVDGTSTMYMRSNAPGGAQLPVLSGAPTSPSQGAIWYDSGDQKVKFQASGGPVTIGSGAGTVTSVGFTAPAELSVAGAPITVGGTIALTWANQTTNKVFAAPDGSTGTPTFRALVANDIPGLAWSKITSGTPTTLAGYGITDAVQNTGNTPSIQAGLDAGKPAASLAGRLYVAYDTAKIYRDNGTTWDTVSSHSSASGDILNGGNTTGAAVTIGTNDAQSLNLETGGTTKLTVTNAGNVGIGTTAPGSALDINGTMRLSGSTSGYVGFAPAAVAGSTTYTLPSADGTTGQLLSTNGSGVLSWASAPSGLPAAAGTAGAPGYAFSGDTDTGMFGAAANQIGLATGGTERVRVDSSGYVGIGTTAPGTALDIAGATSQRGMAAPAVSVAGEGRIYFDSTANKFKISENNGAYVDLVGSGAPTGSAGGDLGGTYPNPTVAKIQGVAVDTTAPADGQVLQYVGGGTTKWVPKNFSIGSLLTAAGAQQFAGSSSCASNQTLTWSALTDTFTCSNITGLASGTTGGGLVTAANGDATAPTYSFAGDTNTGWFRAAADTLAASTAGSERIRIDSSGNIGIGTTAPSDKLEILTNSNTTTSGITVTNANSGATAQSSISVKNDVGASLGIIIGSSGRSAGQVPFANNGMIGSSGGLIFMTDNGTATTGTNKIHFNTGGWNTSPTMTLTGGNPGNVGIGTTTPGSILHVNGAITTDGISAPTTSGAGKGRIYFDSTANKFKVSENNGAYSDLIPTGGTGDILNGGNSTGAAVTIGTNDAYALNVETGGTTKMTVTNAGDVGIGTTAPTAKLSVKSSSVGDFFDVANSAGTKILETGVDSSGSNHGYFRIRNNDGNDAFYIFGDGNIAPHLFVRASDFSIGESATNFFGAAAVIRTNKSTGQENGLFFANQDSPSNPPGAAVTGYTSATAADNQMGLKFKTNSTGGAFTTKMIIDPSGNVGIGTTAPGSILDVKGTLRLSGSTSGYVGLAPAAAAGSTTYTLPSADGTSGQLLSTNGSGVLSWASAASGLPAAAGTAAAPGYAFSGDTDTGVFGAAANQIGLATGGTERVRIDSSGNVGIGTTSPNTALDVSGAISQRGMAAPATSVAGQGRIYFDSTANKFKVSENNGAYADLVNSSSGDFKADGSVQMTGNIRLNNNYLSNDGGNEGIRIDNNGNVAIGLTTPSYPLDVSGIINSNQQINVISNSINTAFYNDSTRGYFGTRTNHPLTIRTNDANRMTFDTSGNVGIGTTAPGSALDVSGTLRLSGSTSGYVGFAPAAAAGSTTYTLPSADGSSGQLLSTNGSGVLSWASAASGLPAAAGSASTPGYAFSGDTDTGMFGAAANQIGFATGGSERVRIDSSGNVGIGTTTATYPLTVAGDTIGIGSGIARMTAANIVNVGISNTVGYNNSIGIGRGNNTGAGDSAVAIGYSNSAASDGATSLGSSNTASYFAVALGRGNTASASGSVAVGAGVTNSIADSLMIGPSNTAKMTILTSGNVGIGTTAPGSALDVSGTLRLSGSTSGYVGFAPAATAGSTTYTLPSADGSTGQVLSTNGSGVLSWASAGGAPSGSAGGDLSGTYPNPTVAKIQGVAVDTTTPTDGQVLQYVGGGTTKWVPKNFSVGSLLTAAGAQQFAGSSSCASNQTLTWSALTDTFTCSNITGLASGTTGGGLVTAANGDATAPTYAFAGDTNTGWFRAAADTLAASTAGSERIRIDSSGNIGIGTTAPGAKLHLNGAMAFEGGGVGWLLTPHAGGSYLGFGSGGTSVTMSNSGIGIYNISGTGSTPLIVTAIGGQTADIVQFRNGSSTSLFNVGANGNVGIGNTSPSTTLHISGAFSVDGMAAPSTSGAGKGRIYFDSTANKFKVSENNGAYADLVSSGSSQWTTNGSDIGYTTGSVGIGTTSPGNRLSVVANNGSTSAMSIQNLSSGGYSSINIYDSAGSMKAYSGYGNTGTAAPYAGSFYFGTPDTSPLVMITNNTERIRVNGSGSVGIGTTNPATALHVNGAFSIDGMAAPSTSGAGKGRIYFDSTANKFKISENNGAYVDLVGSAGLTGSGTTGKIPKWSSSSALTDSAITEGATYMTFARGLEVAGNRSIVADLGNDLLVAGSSGLTSGGGGKFIGGWDGRIDLQAATGKAVTVYTGGATSFKIDSGGTAVWSMAANSSVNNNLTISPTAGGGNLVISGTNLGIGTTSPGEKLEVTGNVSLKHLVGNTSAPTIAAGAGAGSSPSVVTVTGTDLASTVSVTTGTGCSSGIVATITFNTAYTSAPRCVFSPGNSSAAGKSLTSYISSTTTTFVLNGNLNDSTAYIWHVHCIQ